MLRPTSPYILPTYPPLPPPLPPPPLPSLPPCFQLSLDKGRIIAHSTERVKAENIDIILFGEQNFTGCLSNLMINTEIIDLARAAIDMTAGYQGHYDVTTQDVIGGCLGGTQCERTSCPPDSTCESGWNDYLCSCNAEFQPEHGACIHRCVSSPCKNGTCVARALTRCSCPSDFVGPTCFIPYNASCSEAFFSPDGKYASCRACRCDVGGVSAEVCNGTTGQCTCEVCEGVEV